MHRASSQKKKPCLSKGNRRNRLRYAKYTITGWKEVREHPHSSQWCWRSNKVRFGSNWDDLHIPV